MTEAMQAAEPKVSKNRLAKMEQVAILAEKLSAAQAMILADYRGLDVAAVTDLRSRLRKESVEFRVVKNTLLLRAASQSGLTGLEELLQGPTAIALGYDDPVAPAKALSAFAKDHKELEIKGGMLGGRILTVDEVQALAKLPSREELLAKLLGSMQAPLAGMATVLAAPLRGLVTAADALRRQREADAA